MNMLGMFNESHERILLSQIASQEAADKRHTALAEQMMKSFQASTEVIATIAVSAVHTLQTRAHSPRLIVSRADVACAHAL
jgi:hypothetical protein